VLTDGHDSGARTGDGQIEMRLPPGRHTLAVRAGGTMAALGERTVEVQAGEACEVSFTEPAR
jgi:hypothetical protein